MPPSDAISVGVYHCPACDYLSEATLGEGQHRVCPTCGQDFGEDELERLQVSRRVGGDLTAPSTRANAAAAAQPRARQSSSGASSRNEESVGEIRSTDDLKAEKIRIEHRRRKTRWGKWVMLIGGWFALVGGLAVLIALNRTEEGELSKELNAEQLEERRKQQFAARHINECARTLGRFLQADSPEERAQEVLAGRFLTPEMNRYYGGIYEVVDLEIAELKNIGRNLVEMPNGRFRLETRWQKNSGSAIDAVFEQVRDQWLLDWQHFVRASDQSLAGFMASDSESEGEFRLWMRERRPTDRAQSDVVRLAFVEPPIVSTTPVADDRYWAVVQKDSALGEQIVATLDNEIKRKVETELGGSDPPEMHRVRIRLRVLPSENDVGTPELEVVEILADHWLGDYDLGLK